MLLISTIMHCVCATATTPSFESYFSLLAVIHEVCRARVRLAGKRRRASSMAYVFGAVDVPDGPLELSVGTLCPNRKGILRLSRNERSSVGKKTALRIQFARN